MVGGGAGVEAVEGDGGGEVGSGCRAGTLIGVSNYGLMLKSN